MYVTQNSPKKIFGKIISLEKPIKYDQNHLFSSICNVKITVMPILPPPLNSRLLASVAGPPRVRLWLDRPTTSQKRGEEQREQRRDESLDAGGEAKRRYSTQRPRRAPPAGDGDGERCGPEPPTTSRRSPWRSSASCRRLYPAPFLPAFRFLPPLIVSFFHWFPGGLGWFVLVVSWPVSVDYWAFLGHLFGFFAINFGLEWGRCFFFVWICFFWINGFFRDCCSVGSFQCWRIYDFDLFSTYQLEKFGPVS